jgi:hypothetical protein
MILVLFKNPSQRILPIYYAAAEAELGRRGGVSSCSSVQRPGYNRSLFHHGLGRRCGVGRGLGDGVDLGVTVGVGVAIGVELGVTVEVGVGVAVGLEVGVGVTVGVRVGVALAVGVGLGKHTLSTSTKRATVCWFPWSVISTPVTRKPPPFLLVTTEPRAGNWSVPAKTFTASPSRSPSEDSNCTQTVLELKSVHLTR